jgi:hypothetical protein
MFCAFSMAQSEDALAFNSNTSDDFTLETSELKVTKALKSYSLLEDGPYHVTHNQVKKEIEIKLPNVFDVLVFNLYDLDGNKVDVKSKKSNSKIAISLDKVNGGAYILVLRAKDKVYTKRFVNL